MVEQLDSESGIDPETQDPVALDTVVHDTEALSFEEAFRRLGEMVDSLENGGLPLAEATLLYQRGMGLVRRCNRLLNEAELKITQLTSNMDEPAPANDLEWDEDPEI